MQDAIETCPYPELVGKPLGLELIFTFALGHVTELIVLGERMSLVAVNRFDNVGKNIESGQCFFPTKNQSYAATQVLVLWFNSA